MLGTRSLRLAVGRYVRPTQCFRSSNVRVPLLEPTAMIWTRPSFAAAYSKDVKTAEPPLKSNNPDNKSASSLSCTSVTKSSSPSPSKNFEEIKTQTNECSAGTFGEAGIKLPNKDQVQNFVFKSMVYIWDFVYYIFCLSRKLFEKFIVNNSTVQENWKWLQKRMEDARKELKQK